MVEKMTTGNPWSYSEESLHPLSFGGGHPPHRHESWLFNPIMSMVLRKFMQGNLEDMKLIFFSWT